MAPLGDSPPNPPDDHLGGPIISLLIIEQDHKTDQWAPKLRERLHSAKIYDILLGFFFWKSARISAALVQDADKSELPKRSIRLFGFDAYKGWPDHQ